MIVRQITAIFLGVLLQVSLFGGIASAASIGSPKESVTCGCCEIDHCPCASSGEDEKPPLPAIPASQDLKPTYLPASDPEIPGIETRAGPQAPAFSPSSPIAFSGYAGVSISVAFCRFTI